MHTPRSALPQPTPRDKPAPRGLMPGAGRASSHQRFHDPRGFDDNESHRSASQQSYNLESDLIGLQEAQDEVKKLRNEVEELHDENQKLRDIEEQFWLLLTEREELQKEVDSMRAASAEVTKNPRKIPPSTAPSDGPRGVLSEKLQEEHDKMSTALSECLNILIAKEVLSENEYVRKQGPVTAFLSWLEIGHERGMAMASIRGVQDELARQDRDRSASPHTLTSPMKPAQPVGTGAMSQAERNSLTNQLAQAQDELKNLQQELDRTDVSRLQALEDAERLQEQLEKVVENMGELRSAYATLKLQAERSAEQSREVPNLRLKISEKESEISQLKATVLELQRLSDVGGAQLAADAARIRRELHARGHSSSMARTHSPPTPKAIPTE